MIVEGIAATTQLDRHGDRLTLSVLKGMAEEVREHYITSLWNHDPRYPPIGRVVDARVEPLEGTEYALVIVAEYFDEATKTGDGRRIKLEVPDFDSFRVGYDRTVAAADPAGDVDFLASLSGSPPFERGKKSLEPIPEIVIAAGKFAVEAIAAGLLVKATERGWKAIKDRLMERSARSGEELIEMQIGLDVPYPSEVLVILDTPSPSEIEEYFERGFRDVDGLVAYALEREGELAKVVLMCVAGRPRLAYAVRPDGLPVLQDFSLIPAMPALADLYPS